MGDQRRLGFIATSADGHRRRRQLGPPNQQIPDAEAAHRQAE
jgi:hypothetical protein